MHIRNNFEFTFTQLLEEENIACDTTTRKRAMGSLASFPEVFTVHLAKIALKVATVATVFQL